MRGEFESEKTLFRTVVALGPLRPTVIRESCCGAPAIQVFCFFPLCVCVCVNFDLLFSYTCNLLAKRNK